MAASETEETPLKPTVSVPPRLPESGMATPRTLSVAIVSLSTRCLPAGSTIVAVPLPPPRSAAPV